MMRSFIFLLLFSLTSCNCALADPIKVLFDQGHGQAFTIERSGELQLDQFAGRLRDNGWQVEATNALLTPELLSGVDALIISGAFKPLSANEINAVLGFLENGGSLVVTLHIAPPLVSLLDKLGVTSANGVVREGDTSQVIDGEPLNFNVSNLKPHPLNAGLSYFSLYGGWPLRPHHERAQVIASTSPTAWVDLNRDQVLSDKDAVQEFGVLVTGNLGKGEFAVFADDAIFQNRFLKGENEKLVDNLSRWMSQKNATAKGK
ncbi:MAG: DUF4350 domain-containing protein [Desulfuromonadales bacterium]|nr:DUF4350 domain-containing protein [Desulfuromonadales bacterium]